MQNTAKPTFGRVQSYAPKRAGAGAASYAPPQVANYADIVGDAFQGGNASVGGSYAGMTASANPVKGLRFVSGLIDFTLLMTLSFLILIVNVFTELKMGRTADESGIPAVVWLVVWGLWLGYGIVMEASAAKGTVGKMLTGTVVVNKDGSRLSFGQVIGRNAGKLLSGCIPLYIPYFMVLWTNKGQSLHDMMCGSYVYKNLI